MMQLKGELESQSTFHHLRPPPQEILNRVDLFAHAARVTLRDVRLLGCTLKHRFMLLTAKRLRYTG